MTAFGEKRAPEGPPARDDVASETRRLLDKMIRERLAASKGGAGILRRSAPGPAPLSFAQQRLWFLDQLTPGNPVYNIPTVVRIAGIPDAPGVRQALQELVRRHEILRTTFEEVDGRPVQNVGPSFEVPVDVVDLRSLTRAEREAETLRLANDEARRPFDLARGPLLRARVLRLDALEYVFVLTMHHIITDGWSMGVLFRELTEVYRAITVGQRPLLPELPIQYADYAAWQRQWLQGPVLESHLTYWKVQLQGVKPLDLPTDRPRPPVQTFRGAHHLSTVAAPLTEAVKRLSQREGVTLFMTLLAAFKVLLHRHTGQDDIVVGSYIAGRNRTELEGLIGFFLNTLVLRTDLAGAPSFRAVLRRIRDVAVDAYEHQDFPFEKLVEELRPERDLSRNPLCQIAFQLQNATSLAGATSGTMPELLGVNRGASIFDLSTTVCESGRELLLYFEYSTELFDAGTIDRMARHFTRILEVVADAPDTRISELPLMSPDEYRAVVFEWNATQTEVSHRGLVDLFEDQVKRAPDSPAFSCEGELLTYGDLNRRANRLAHYVGSLGAEPAFPVGVCLDRSLGAAVALLGVLKAGGAYLPLDPSYPRERLRYMLADSGTRILLTRRDLADVFTGFDVRLVCIDSDREAINSRSEENLGIPTSLDSIAYVIYTSGSTGVPKGVAAPHRQLLNRFQWMWRTYPFQPDEVCCQKTALSFVDSLWELLGPLLKGVHCVILRDPELRDPDRLVERLADERVTRIWVVPSFLKLILDSATDLGRRLPLLTFWVTSGEALSAPLFEQFNRAMPHAALYNLYGTSEVWDATWFDPARENGVLWHVPIGKPIDNVRVYVLDTNRQPVPVGVPGELYVAGLGLARGYLRGADLMKDSFVQLSFLPSSGSLAYQTGDRVRFLADGNLEYLGRLDEQVQIRGFRVEPAEIEAALTLHPEIRQISVVARSFGTEPARLVAYIVSNPGTTLGATQLRRFLLEKLPEFMVPSEFVRLDALPLTPSGKIDRRALPLLADGRRNVSEPFVAPRTKVEEVIAQIWREVLPAGDVGVHDNFFDLGGHSLVAIQAVSRMRARFEIEFPLVRFFEVPTVAGLAEAVEQATQSGRRRPEPPLQAVPRSSARVRVSSSGQLPTAAAQRPEIEQRTASRSGKEEG